LTLALLIGMVKTDVMRKVMVQSTLCTRHINQRYSDKKVKGHVGQEAKAAQVAK
jgi:hypothetical protein